MGRDALEGSLVVLRACSFLVIFLLPVEVCP
jgi:hypothetical protein